MWGTQGIFKVNSKNKATREPLVILRIVFYMLVYLSHPMGDLGACTQVLSVSMTRGKTTSLLCSMLPKKTHDGTMKDKTFTIAY